MHSTLRGVEAIRGFCVSANPITDLCMSLNGRAIHREGPLNGYSLKYEGHDRNKRKYVFNVWYDFYNLPMGCTISSFSLFSQTGADEHSAIGL